MTGTAHSKARVVTLLVLTFTAGLAIGVGGSHLLATGPVGVEGQERVEAESRRGGDDRPGDRSGQPRFAIERHADELGLTAEQRETIDAILADVRAEMDTIMADMRPRFREIYRSARTDIEAVLTPDQAARYGEILDARRGRSDGRDEARVGPKEGEESE